MTAPRRRGEALLVGLVVGALLIGLATLVGGVRPAPAGLDAAALPPPAAAPDTTGAPAVAGPPAAAPAAPPVLDAGPSSVAAGSGGGRPAGVPDVARAPAAVRAPAVAARPRATTARATRKPATAGPEQQVVTLTNAQRAQAGCAPLTVDSRLTAAAREHSTDMAQNGYFDHDSQDGRSFSDRETAAGYPNPGGENIAYGQGTAAEVMNDWMNSDGHRRNILDCSFTTIGVGLATDGMYWTQDFGR